ncbi:MAG: glycosyltransferase [Betaproteobacteria bacterium]
MLDYTRQHAHFFIEAGLPFVYWLPGLNVHRIPVPSAIEPEVALSFVGHVGRYHPRRLALCRALSNAGLPLQVSGETNQQARLIHARARVNLNCSLNGDLNLRIFEILQSGGCLLTDRLTPEAGLDLLLKDGEHFAGYSSFDECISSARALLADPARARRLAVEGKAAYEARLSPERIARDFFALVERGTIRPEFDVRRDSRLALVHGALGLALLRERIQLYEFLQQIHKGRESTRVLIAPNVDPRAITDIADLARLHCVVDMTSDKVRAPQLADLLAKAGVAARIRIGTQEGDPDVPLPDVLLGSAADWRSGALRTAMSRHARATVLLMSATDDIAAELAAAGIHRLAKGAPLYARVSR